MTKILVTGGSGFIGTTLIESIDNPDFEIKNIDISFPKKKSHNKFWEKCNILDKENLKKIFLDYEPVYVVHLAARATTNGQSLDDYPDNTIGTKNVLDAINETPSIQRVIITSSQHVRKPGSGLPQHDSDYVPHGPYGESKVVTEQLTRSAKLSCEWIIIRPTTIWGPYHPFLPSGLWRLMSKGLYFHPKNDPVVRSYGYVKNTAWIIKKLLEAPSELVDKRTFYVGDEPIKQEEWIDAFSMALAGRPAPKVSKEYIKFLSKIGDLLSVIKIPFPMNSPRFFNLTTTNPVPINPVIRNFGKPPYTLQESIQETTEWLAQIYEQK